MKLIYLLILTLLIKTQVKSQTSDYQQLLSSIEGEYDNLKQFQGDSKVGRMHISYHRVQAEAIGKDVFYVKYYKDNDPKKLYRQRLLTFSFDTQNNQIKAEALSFLIDSVYVDLNLKPDLQRVISKKDIRSSLGCPNIWIKENGDFIGKSDACQFFSARRNKNILISDKMRLTPTSLSTTEAGKELDGTIIFGSLDTYALVLDRQ